MTHRLHRLPGVARLCLAALLGLLVVAGVVTVPAHPARADSAPANPALPTTPATVAADALPTVQINGVVWSQTVVGNTVFAAGKFTRARPAGSPAGVNETVRNNLLAYDIRTGDLITSFAPDLNGQALTVAASPDGSRLYVGGDFTIANGKPRYRLAVYSTATGALLDDFQPVIGGEVRAIVATGSTVYVGGLGWGSAGGATRNYLAAFAATTGKVLAWAPRADQLVDALALVDNGSAVVIAGSLQQLNGQTVNGIGEVDAVTGQSLPFAASTATQTGGVNSGYLSLSTDADTVYASAFSWNNGGNFEGVLAVNPKGGAVRWIDDCRGDTYSVFATGTEEYVAGHAHDCQNLGGFPQSDPDPLKSIGHRAIAFSKAATGYVGSEYGWFTGQPAPSLLDWFPYLQQGTVTGEYQAAWSVTGNDQYVVYGGEFPSVNGANQQGLVRFAVPAIAPDRVGPDGTAGLTPTVVSTAAGTARVSWQTTWDMDNAVLTYDVYRSDMPGVPVYTTTASSTWWRLPTLSFLDRSAPAGTSVTYRVTARDPFGNSVTGAATAVTIATTGAAALDDYATAVVADGPTSYWRLDERSGSTVHDSVGTFDAVTAGGVTLGRPGALTGRTDTAASFSGTSSGSVSTQATVVAPNDMSMEAWFSTTSRSGGQVIGFGDKTAGTLSPNHDRFIALNGSGQVSFNVWPFRNVTVRSAAGYNDGRWHHVVGTMSPAGASLYLDGKLVGTASDGTSGQNLTGYWKLGGDTTWDGSGPWLQGSIDEVAVYSRALTAGQVARHYAVGSSQPPANAAPIASFTSASSGLSVAVNGAGSTDADGTVTSWAWDFGDGQTGTGKSASHTYAASGTYAVTLTVTDDGGATGVVTRQVTVTDGMAPGSERARDGFGRELTSQWGVADLGGAWTIQGTAANASVTGGTGRLTAAAGTGIDAVLPLSDRDVSVSADVSLEEAPTGGGTYYSVGARSNGTSRYGAQLGFGADGSVVLSVLSVVKGTQTELAHQFLPGKYTPGSALRLRFQVAGVGTTTLSAKAWPSTASEPAAWQVTATDTTPTLQSGGALYAGLYTSKSSTSAAAARLDNVSAVVPGAAAPPPANAAPVASFTSSVSGLSVSVDGSGSTDADGTVTSWAWDFGDGQTGTGKSASHTYAASGTYAVTLTVTDDGGATGTVSRSVSVAAPPAAGTALAQDAFGREVTGGWGSADVGGAWTIVGPAGNASVTGGTGRLTAAAGTGAGAALGVSAQDVALAADVLLAKQPAGAASLVSLGGRNNGGNRYKAQLYFGTDGSVSLRLVAVVNWGEKTLATVALPGKYTAGSVLRLRFQVAGSGTTTLSAKAWPSTASEPAAWQVTATDTTPALQGAGGVYLDLYTGGSATSPQTLQIDNVWAGAAGTEP